MPRTITLDGVEPTQMILMKEQASGKVLVQATYRVKAGQEVVKTVLDRSLTAMAAPGQALGPQPNDPLSTTEKAAISAAWDAVVAAVQRLELS